MKDAQVTAKKHGVWLLSTLVSMYIQSRLKRLETPLSRSNVVDVTSVSVAGTKTGTAEIDVVHVVATIVGIRVVPVNVVAPRGTPGTAGVLVGETDAAAPGTRGRRRTTRRGFLGASVRDGKNRIVNGVQRAIRGTAHPADIRVRAVTVTA
jgi:hypothetical protein